MLSKNWNGGVIWKAWVEIIGQPVKGMALDNINSVNAHGSDRPAMNRRATKQRPMNRASWINPALFCSPEIHFRAGIK
jgi:hypothetical protein